MQPIGASEFDFLAGAVASAEQARSKACGAFNEAYDAVRYLAPVLPTVLREMHMKIGVPPEWEFVDESEYLRLCRYAVVSDKEARIGWIVLRGWRRALRRARCDCGLPELEAARTRAETDLEDAWSALVDAPAPNLFCALRKLQIVRNRCVDAEGLDAVLTDFSRLIEAHSDD